MHQITDVFAVWGVVSAAAVILAAGRAVRKLRAAKAHLEKGWAGSRAAGEAAVPSTYTIPKGPST